MVKSFTSIALKISLLNRYRKLWITRYLQNKSCKTRSIPVQFAKNYACASI
jgi:hypothetical protein